MIPLYELALEVRIPLEGLVDFGAEKETARKEAEKTQADIDYIEKKLNNEAFMAKAPAELVAKENLEWPSFNLNSTELRAALSKIQ